MGSTLWRSAHARSRHPLICQCVLLLPRPTFTGSELCHILPGKSLCPMGTGTWEPCFRQAAKMIHNGIQAIQRFRDLGGSCQVTSAARRETQPQTRHPQWILLPKLPGCHPRGIHGLRVLHSLAAALAQASLSGEITGRPWNVHASMTFKAPRWQGAISHKGLSYSEWTSFLVFSSMRSRGSGQSQEGIVFQLP